MLVFLKFIFDKWIISLELDYLPWRHNQLAPTPQETRIIYLVLLFIFPSCPLSFYQAIFSSFYLFFSDFSLRTSSPISSFHQIHTFSNVSKWLYFSNFSRKKGLVPGFITRLEKGN
jgi:hypothetical protein